ncbi:MAG: Transketolase [Fimbriimonadaceae bacterium]|nr:Transketolase [Fimbriimonadaceae bacterium]
MAHVLWTRHLRHNPRNPKWVNRDRFILSAGHGSMLLYALLHLTGYDLSMEEIKNFRQFGSKTPGHPENVLTPGVEMATGPLGQGFATAVGMAIAQANLGERFNRPGLPIFDHYTYVLCSDGDLMEGICQEAASLAGHLGLGKLIALYDDNGITIDGSTSLAFTEDTQAKFEALGWHTIRIDGMDMEAVDRALSDAKAVEDRPSLILARTVIGFGSPNKAGSEKSHGSPLGEEEVRLTKQALDLPDTPFYVEQEVVDFYRRAVAVGEVLEAAWEKSVRDLADPDLDRLLGELPEGWAAKLPTFTEPVSTRVASGKALQVAAAVHTGLMGGSADLSENVFTVIRDCPVFQSSSPEGRTLMFGVREHAMMAAANGLTLHGATRGYGGTFLIFSDYCRPSIRLASLMECPTIFVFSHDSIGLGEDGPTHQPIEQIMSLRAIPGLNVMRPADGNEVSACWMLALEHHDGPSLIVTSRQNLPIITSADIPNHPARSGAYVLADSPLPQICLVATGSEVSLALAAKDLLTEQGMAARVVSMPSWFLFERQTADYRAGVLNPEMPTVSVEAGVTLGWSRYAQAHVGIDHFGASAPGPVVMKEFGFTPENVANVAKGLLGRA